MHRFIRRYRKTGLALLAVFVIQVIAVGFCAIPSTHAAPASLHATTNLQCSMDIPIPAEQDVPECAHCKVPDFSTFSNQINNVPVTWALITILPTLLHQNDFVSEQRQPLFIAFAASPRSASLLFRTSRRIRL